MAWFRFTLASRAGTGTSRACVPLGCQGLPLGCTIKAVGHFDAVLLSGDWVSVDYVFESIALDGSGGIGSTVTSATSKRTAAAAAAAAGQQLPFLESSQCSWDECHESWILFTSNSRYDDRCDIKSIKKNWKNRGNVCCVVFKNRRKEKWVTVSTLHSICITRYSTTACL